MSECPVCKGIWSRILHDEWAGHSINRSFNHTLDVVSKFLPSENFKLIGMFSNLTSNSEITYTENTKSNAQSTSNAHEDDIDSLYESYIDQEYKYIL